MASIGKYGWIPFMVAGLGNIFGGIVSGAMIKRSVSVTVARKLTLTLFALLMLSAIAAVLTPDVRLSIGFISLAMIGYTGGLTNMLSFPSDIYPEHMVGSVGGWQACARDSAAWSSRSSPAGWWTTTLTRPYLLGLVYFR